MPNNSIDKWLKERLTDYNSPGDPLEGWDALAPLIEERKKDKKRLFLWIWTMGFLIALTAGYFYLLPKPPIAQHAITDKNHEPLHPNSAKEVNPIAPSTSYSTDRSSSVQRKTNFHKAKSNKPVTPPFASSPGNSNPVYQKAKPTVSEWAGGAVEQPLTQVPEHRSLLSGLYLLSSLTSKVSTISYPQKETLLPRTYIRNTPAKLRPNTLTLFTSGLLFQQRFLPAGDGTTASVTTAEQTLHPMVSFGAGLIYDRALGRSPWFIRTGLQWEQLNYRFTQSFRDTVDVTMNNVIISKRKKADQTIQLTRGSQRGKAYLQVQRLKYGYRRSVIVPFYIGVQKAILHHTVVSGYGGLNWYILESRKGPIALRPKSLELIDYSIAADRHAGIASWTVGASIQQQLSAIYGLRMAFEYTREVRDERSTLAGWSNHRSLLRFSCGVSMKW